MSSSTSLRRAWIGLAVLALPCAVTVMDMTVLNLAVPRLTEALKPSSVELLWIIDMYGFMLAGALIPIGGLGDRIGRRKLFLIGAAGFAVASLLAAFAPSALTLIAARALLGVAGAALVPSTLSLLPILFEDEQSRTKAIGVWGASFAVGAAIGPLVGGILLEHFWWGSVFLVGVPVMAIVLVLGPRLLPEFRDTSAAAPDVSSGLLSIAAILSTVYGLKQSVQDGLSPLSAATIIVGCILGLVFIRRQQHLSDPMLDLSLFADRVFSVSIASNVVNVFVSFGSFILLSQYLQLGLGLSPLQAGLLSLPASACAVVGPMLSPVLSERFGMRASLTGLLAITACGFAFQIAVGGALSVYAVALGWALWAMGGSAAATLTTGTIIGSARPERAGAVSALAQTGAELGGALGIALIGSLGSAVYRGLVSSAISGAMSPELAETVRQTAGGALSVATELGDASLLLAAQNALTAAVQLTSAVSAVLSLATALAVLLYFSKSSREPTEVAYDRACERVDNGDIRQLDRLPRLDIDCGEPA